MNSPNFELPTHSGLTWRPIETAPKDRDILVCDARTLDGCCQVVCWDDSADDESMWRWATSDGPTFHRLAFTHWLPLPKPPAE